MIRIGVGLSRRIYSLFIGQFGPTQHVPGGMFDFKFDRGKNNDKPH